MPPPTTRERPPGCRTIFVGGLPENTTEELLTEIFENCGRICSIRMSKKNFAHIRFELEESVDRAIYISGMFYILFHIFLLFALNVHFWAVFYTFSINVEQGTD